MSIATLNIFSVTYKTIHLSIPYKYINKMPQKMVKNMIHQRIKYFSIFNGECMRKMQCALSIFHIFCLLIHRNIFYIYFSHKYSYFGIIMLIFCIFHLFLWYGPHMNICARASYQMAMVISSANCLKIINFMLSHYSTYKLE